MSRLAAVGVVLQVRSSAGWSRGPQLRDWGVELMHLGGGESRLILGFGEAGDQAGVDLGRKRLTEAVISREDWGRGINRDSVILRGGDAGGSSH